jgi:hypothetical protein
MGLQVVCNSGSCCLRGVGPQLAAYLTSFPLALVEAVHSVGVHAVAVPTNLLCSVLSRQTARCEGKEWSHAPVSVGQH